MSSWQCSEEQARAIESACWTAPEHAKREACRAAVTDAIGPEIDRLRAELAEVRAQAEADHREIETLSHYRVEAQRCDARAAKAEKELAEVRGRLTFAPWTKHDSHGEWYGRTCSACGGPAAFVEKPPAVREWYWEANGNGGFLPTLESAKRAADAELEHCADWRKREG